MIYETMLRRQPASAETFATGIKGIGFIGLYVLPIVTFPMIPMALLAMGSRGKLAMGSRKNKIQPFNPLSIFRAINYHAKDFTILWLFLMLWSAALLLSLAMVWLIKGIIESLLPPFEGQMHAVVWTIFPALITALVAVTCGFLGLVIFRCVGLFGRGNVNALAAGK